MARYSLNFLLLLVFDFEPCKIVRLLFELFHLNSWKKCWCVCLQCTFYYMITKLTVHPDTSLVLVLILSKRIDDPMMLTYTLIYRNVSLPGSDVWYSTITPRYLSKNSMFILRGHLSPAESPHL